MPLTLRQKVPPTSEPVTVSEVRQHLRIDTVEDVELLTSFIVAARVELEELTRRQFLTATWELSCDGFPREFRLPRVPTQSVESIEYIDVSGTLQILDASVYQVDLISEPARIREAPGQSWPSVEHTRLNSVIVTYKAGAPTVSQVPAVLKLAMRMMIGDLYEHREGMLDIAGPLKSIVQNTTLDRLIGLYKVWHPDL